MLYRPVYSPLRLAGALAAWVVISRCLAQAPPPPQPPVQVMGAAGGQLGPDTYGGVNWKGPDVITYGYYDRLPVSQDSGLEELLTHGPIFAGRVRPRTVTVAQALSLGRQALAKNRIILPAKAVGSSPQGRNVHALQAQAAGELLRRRTLRALGFQMLAYEAAPREAAIALNLAGLFATAGLPNEAIALLDEVDRLGPLPAAGNFVSAQALAAYLRGYAEMQRGNLAKAKELLRRAHKTDPFLREAGLALAVVQAQLGEADEARKTYTTAVWRRIPARVVLEEKTKTSAGEVDPTAEPGSAEAAASQRINRPMPEMFDLSHGKEGRMPVYKFPRNVGEVMALRLKSDPRLSAELSQLVARIAKLGPVPYSDRRTPYGAWADRFETMIGIVYLWEPSLLPLYRERTKVERAFELEHARIKKRLTEQQVAANKRYFGTGKSVPCGELRDMSNAAINSFTSTANLLDMAERRYYRLWYRLSSALVAQVGDPKWHQRIAEHQQIEADRQWLHLASRLNTKYELLLATGVDWPECSSPANRDEEESRRQDELEKCPDSLRGRAVEFQVEMPFAEGVSPKLALEFSCESVTLSFGVDFQADAAIVEFGAGPFGEVEIERAGDVTIFIGASGSGSAGAAAAEVKAGGYLTVNKEGIKDAGLKGETEAKVTAKIGGVSASVLTKSDLFKVSFVPGVPERPRGPMLKTFGAGPGGGG